MALWKKGYPGKFLADYLHVDLWAWNHNFPTDLEILEAAEIAYPGSDLRDDPPILDEEEVPEPDREVQVETCSLREPSDLTSTDSCTDSCTDSTQKVVQVHPNDKTEKESESDNANKDEDDHGENNENADVVAQIEINEDHLKDNIKIDAEKEITTDNANKEEASDDLKEFDLEEKLCEALTDVMDLNTLQRIRDAGDVVILPPDVTAVYFKDEQTGLQKHWQNYVNKYGRHWNNARGLHQQLDDFYKMNPHVKKVYGNMMGEFEVSQPLESLIWYPNHDISCLRLQGQDIATSLHWLSATPRMYVEFAQNLPLKFPNLKVVDLQCDCHSAQFARQLLSDCPSLTYLSLAVWPHGPDRASNEENKDPIPVACPSLKVAHLRGLRAKWVIKGKALDSIEELALDSYVDIEGAMPNLKRLHIMGSVRVNGDAMLLQARLPVQLSKSSQNPEKTQNSSSQHVFSIQDHTYAEIVKSPVHKEEKNLVDAADGACMGKLMTPVRGCEERKPGGTPEHSPGGTTLISDNMLPKRETIIEMEVFPQPGVDVEEEAREVVTSMKEMVIDSEKAQENALPILPNVTHLRLEYLSNCSQLEHVLTTLLNPKTLKHIQVSMDYFRFCRTEQNSVKTKNQAQIVAIIERLVTKGRPEGEVQVEYDSKFTLEKSHWLEGHYGTGFGIDGVWGLQLY